MINILNIIATGPVVIAYDSSNFHTMITES